MHRINGEPLYKPLATAKDIHTGVNVTLSLADNGKIVCVTDSGSYESRYPRVYSEHEAKTTLRTHIVRDWYANLTFLNPSAKG